MPSAAITVSMIVIYFQAGRFFAMERAARLADIARPANRDIRAYNASYINLRLDGLPVISGHGSGSLMLCRVSFFALLLNPA